MHVTEEQAKLTAHGMWSSLLSDELHAIFYPLRPQKKAEMESIHNKVISTVLKHETTRLRVHVDEMISRLQAWDKTAKSLEAEYKATSWIRFNHRSKLKKEHFRSIGVREAFQNAVLVLTNTPPEITGPPGGNVFDSPKGKVKVPSSAASMSKADLKVNR